MTGTGSQNTIPKGADMKNVSDETCLFAVQGPKATAVLRTLTKVDLSKIRTIILRSVSLPAFQMSA
ncbi:MAG: hypothetical protein WDN75_12670 [Bacteroidota bacterium]